MTGRCPKASLNRLLEAAIWAPSAHNRQPWRLVIMTSTETKQSLATAMGRQLRADLAADGVPTEAIERDASRSYSRIYGRAAADPAVSQHG